MIDANEVQEIEQEEIEQEVEQDEVQINPEQEKAMKNGWRPKEEWDGDADDWVSAKKFNERGEMIGAIRDLKGRLDKGEKAFEARLENVNRLHETQQKALLADLEAKRNDAIELADVAGVQRIQNQIDDIRSTPAQPAVKNHSVIDEWNAANPWIYDQHSPKTTYAMARFNFHAQNMGEAEAIKAMETEVAKAFPDVNERRNSAKTVESGRSRPGQRQQRKLSWGDLTHNEIQYFNAMPGAWSKEEYLQAVADSRKA